VEAVPLCVNVPGGFDAGGAWSRAVSLRPCTGADEAWLVEAGGLLPSERTTGLLGRCLGDVALARRLTLGDREALLLHLRRLSLGERLAWVADCGSCGGRMDLDARVTDFLLPAYAHQGPEHRARLEALEVRFRLPTGGDQEEASRAGGLQAGVAVLLERCVREVRAGERVLARLPEAAVPALSAAMAARDPQAELVLAGDCPHCAAPFARPLDAGQILEEELAGDGEALFREVHVLASAYHWSEAEILALTLQQRRRYLGLIAADRRTG
jgi:hypothetical protein